MILAYQAKPQLNVLGYDLRTITKSEKIVLVINGKR